MGWKRVSSLKPVRIWLLLRRIMKKLVWIPLKVLMKEKNTEKKCNNSNWPTDMIMGQGHSKTALDLMIFFLLQPKKSVSTLNPLNQNYMHFNLDIYSGLEPIFII